MNFWNTLSKYLSVNLKDYPNIGIDLQINKILLFVFIGITVASFSVNYNRYLICTLMKKLHRHACQSEDSAKTLSELGLTKSGKLRAMLTENSRLRSMISIVGIEKLTYEEYIDREKARKKDKKKGSDKDKSSDGIDWSSARLYINPDSTEKANRIIAQPAPTVLNTILFSVLMILVYVCLSAAMPEILTIVNNMLKL